MSFSISHLGPVFGPTFGPTFGPIFISIELGPSSRQRQRPPPPPEKEEERELQWANPANPNAAAAGPRGPPQPPRIGQETGWRQTSAFGAMNRQQPGRSVSSVKL